MKDLIGRMEARAELQEVKESECKGKFMDGEHFKGKKGERFENCVKYMKCKGTDSPEGVCGKIARAKAQSEGEEAPYGPNDLIVEAERASRQMVAKAADAMITSPGAKRYLDKLPGLDLTQVQQGVEAMLIQLMSSAGVGVSGGGQATRAMRGMARGKMPQG